MKRISAIFLLILLALSLPAAAKAPSKTLPMDKFAAIPVLHEGRMKPLSSLAAVELDKLSGGSAKIAPLPWLAETLFNPQYATQRPIFKVSHPEILTRFNLPQRNNKLYSLEELGPGLSATHEQARKLAQSAAENMPPDQEALVTLHEKALTYAQIVQAMAPFLPMEVTVPQGLDINMQAYGDLPIWLEVKKQEPVMLGRLEALLAKKGENIAQYTDDEKALATLAFAYRQIQQTAPGNYLFRIIPPQWADANGEWLSPWALLGQGKGGPESSKLLTAWQHMAKAYRSADVQNWEKASAEAYNLAIKQSGQEGLSARLKTELVYNALSPFKLSVALYGVAALLGALFLWRQNKFIYTGAALALFAGTAANGAGIIMRVAILARPPVGSLYESLLFVTLIIAAAALVLEFKRRDAIALTGAAAASLLILFIAPVIAPDGDDLQVLVAVLNTNFWLATHVICITAGYAFCLLTAALAHIWLFRSGNAAPRKQDGLTRNIYILSLISLLLTAVGTVLGGIWADQSWGRFWGWDPKENGALLIVLWLVWLHHGRLGNHLDMRAFQAGMATLGIIVALAWFGVNLLSVGLHSYGFISGIATGLAAFCTAEISIIGALWYRAHRKTLAKTSAKHQETT